MVLTERLILQFAHILILTFTKQENFAVEIQFTPLTYYYLWYQTFQYRYVCRVIEMQSNYAENLVSTQ